MRAKPLEIVIRADGEDRTVAIRRGSREIEIDTAPATDELARGFAVRLAELTGFGIDPDAVYAPTPITEEVTSK
jgi:hypothetical protein